MPPGRQFDHEIVDGVVGSALHDVQRKDVGAHRSQGHGQRAEAAWSVGQLDAEQIGRHAATVPQWRALGMSACSASGTLESELVLPAPRSEVAG